MIFSRNKIWNIKIIILFLISVLLFSGCAKPIDPESIMPVDMSGGYTIVNKIETEGFAQDVIKKGNLLYVTQGQGGLVIIDVSNLNSPIIISNTTEGVRGYSKKISMKDSAIYIAAGTFGVTVIDVGDSTHPIVSTSNTSMKPAINLHIMGNYLFTATSETGVKIANITDVLHPDTRGSIETIGYANDICTYKDSTLLLVASGEMGLQVFDISDFSEGWGGLLGFPLVGKCDTKGVAECIKLSNNAPIAFMACGTGGLQIINFADTNHIFIAGSYSCGGYAKELIYENNRVYITTETRGLQIFDVSDVSHPKLVGVIKTEYALGVDVDEKYIYIADEEEGLIIVAKPQFK